MNLQHSRAGLAGPRMRVPGSSREFLLLVGAWGGVWFVGVVMVGVCCV